MKELPCGIIAQLILSFFFLLAPYTSPSHQKDGQAFRMLALSW